jgi:glycerophosphoryl diester phosphodiesterase
MSLRALLAFAPVLVACQGGAAAVPVSETPASAGEPIPLPSFRVIGHRGAAGHAPENTLPSFEVAKRLGVEEVQLDVQISRDGVPVLFHDGSLADKTRLEGRVAEHDAATLGRAELGSWFASSHPAISERFDEATLTSLDQVLDRFGDTFHYHIELTTESRQAPRLVLETLERHRLRRRATISSFHAESLGVVRRLDPEIPITLLVEDVDDLGRAAQVEEALAGLFGSGLQQRRIQQAVNSNFQTVAFPARDLTRELVEHAHGRDLQIRAWGVHTPQDLDRAIESGADGATLDRPEWALDRRRS